ncbi:hypothetical protein X801_02857 [Opisthorchis viverrini]|uniref:Cyanocobalamin reductase (cyanide-eliminating) n=1 Tax=Opisthorchis viverrini TaxID=6198 RepID=A0A1S8X3J5_OPIVI|nr:hypothetical protein X801_02857 [Opisthorchis viverrini]
MPDNEHSQLNLINRTIQCLRGQLCPFGFELAPFLVGWYNDIVSARLKIDTVTAPSDDCVALCIISSPHMFENSFLHHLFDWFKGDEVTSLANALKSIKPNLNGCVALPGPNDPLDWSVLLRIHDVMEASLGDLKAQLPSEEYQKLIPSRFIPDYAMKPVVRLPYIHVQCAGHVSGIAYFHRDDPIHGSSSAGGCSLHPHYGGWFGFRGAIVFPNLRCPTLPRPVPISSLPPGHPPFPPESVTLLLDSYRNRWRENEWRNLGLPRDSTNIYSPAARCFFNTPPEKRAALLEGWVRNADLLSFADTL